MCGKEGLKYLYFIKNKKKVESEQNGDDLNENATKTLTIGEFLKQKECFTAHTSYYSKI